MTTCIGVLTADRIVATRFGAAAVAQLLFEERRRP
jgi:hypothetical protein